MKRPDDQAAVAALAFVTVAIEHLHDVDRILEGIATSGTPQTRHGVIEARARVRTARGILEHAVETVLGPIPRGNRDAP